jgi:hypothetical protein
VAARELRPDQPILLVDREIVGAVGIEGAHLLAFTDRLRQVRVDPAVRTQVAIRSGVGTCALRGVMA